MTPAQFRPVPTHDAEARARHGRWLAMFSDSDWARIRALARQTGPTYSPGALTDLEAPLKVSCVAVGQARRHPGEQVGALRDGQVAVLVTEMTASEHEQWRQHA
jgi:hypothetical protein